jgi:hypothetical protein
MQRLAERAGFVLDWGFPLQEVGMLRRAQVLSVLLSAACLMLNGCLLRNLQGTPVDCDVDTMQIGLDIQANLAGRQTFSHFGSFSKDGQDHKAGDPCRYSLASDFESAEEFLPTAGYSVQRDGARLVLTQPLHPAGSADPKAQAELDKFKGKVKSLTLTVHYDGRIMEHNADRVDAAAHELTWDLLHTQKTEVRFVLQTVVRPLPPSSGSEQKEPAGQPSGPARNPGS